MKHRRLFFIATLILASSVLIPGVAAGGGVPAACDSVSPYGRIQVVGRGPDITGAPLLKESTGVVDKFLIKDRDHSTECTAAQYGSFTGLRFVNESGVMTDRYIQVGYQVNVSCTDVPQCLGYTEKFRFVAGYGTDIGIDAIDWARRCGSDGQGSGSSLCFVSIASGDSRSQHIGLFPHRICQFRVDLFSTDQWRNGAKDDWAVEGRCRTQDDSAWVNGSGYKRIAVFYDTGWRQGLPLGATWKYKRNAIGALDAHQDLNYRGQLGTTYSQWPNMFVQRDDLPDWKVCSIDNNDYRVIADTNPC